MINPNIFLYASTDGLVCWNFKDHKQFLLNHDYAARLIAIACGGTSIDLNNPIDRDLYSAELASSKFISPAHWGWDPLSRIFHIGTRDIPILDIPRDVTEWAKLYLAHCEKALEKPFPAENCVEYSDQGLNLPLAEDTGWFDKLLSKRMTVRSFLGNPIPLMKLSKLLKYSLGFMPHREKSCDTDIPNHFRNRRCSASGGGLNSTEGYIYANHVEGLPRGIYYYNPHRHTLHFIEKNLPELGSLLSGQHFANEISVGIFLTSRLDKLWWKYSHSRAYRMALVEIGHIAQTFQLYACELGLGTWLTGALNENSIESLLKLRNPSEQPMFFVGAGHTDGSHTPEALIQLTNKNLTNFQK